MINRLIFITAIIILAACSNSDNEDENLLYGVVAGVTSCSGGQEPVYVIKLNETDSIITATLSSEYQLKGLYIKFQLYKDSENLIYCTTDKIYPEYFDVYNVSLATN
ncbi:hypothetical protein [Neotamlana laminarinivorans]|uniref:Lipoprotein n=1 Tax=Neotamlana laminarinivorans TaxID=2883124 RepID=A0A9X1I1B7_9FLAO|nr:hypothetical protein [Tamlana laminarinivorans]MCB4798377.1 hypothetical protein [Tamlana laminarinivorans]